MSKQSNSEAVSLPASFRYRHCSEWTRRELRTLPHREWNAIEERYDSLLIFSSGRNHESGWKAMVIVGCRDQIPVEICTDCSDDIEWKLPNMKTFGQRGKWSIGQMRMDCTSKAGILHAWCRDGKFCVGNAISSISVELVTESNKEECPVCNCKLVTQWPDGISECADCAERWENEQLK